MVHLQSMAHHSTTTALPHPITKAHHHPTTTVPHHHQTLNITAHHCTITPSVPASPLAVVEADSTTTEAHTDMVAAAGVDADAEDAVADVDAKDGLWVGTSI